MENTESNSIKFQIKGGIKRKRVIGSSDFDSDNENDDGTDISSKVIIREGNTRFDGKSLPLVKEKPLLVIPLYDGLSSKIAENKANNSSNTSQSNLHHATSSNENKLSLDEQAAKEIMEELMTDNKPKDGLTSTLVIESSNANESADGSIGSKKTPLLLANIASELKGLATDEERFKKDILLRADDMDVRSNKYKSVPVEEFGAALLRGMGWEGPTDEDKERMKKAAEPMAARDSRLGLGAIAKPPERDSKNPNKKKTKEQWDRKIDDTLKKQGLKDGDLVWLRTPSEVGKRAQVIAVRGVPGLDKVRVRMELDGRVLEVNRTDAIILSQAALQDESYHMKYKDIPDKSREVEYKGLEGFDISSIDKKKDDKKSNLKHNSSVTQSKSKIESHREVNEQSWLCSSIRVRIVSDKYGKRAHLQKGMVEDVHRSGHASVRLDDGSYFESVKEKHLETVLPPVGGVCRILRGEHKNEHATLLEKKKDRDRAIVQLSEDYEVIEISMNDIAATS